MKRCALVSVGAAQQNAESLERDKTIWGYSI